MMCGRRHFTTWHGPVQPDGPLTNFEASYRSFKAVVLEDLGTPSWHLDAAMRCKNMCLDRPEFTSSGLQLQTRASIIELLPDILWLGHSVKRRYEELTRAGKSVSTAVCAAALADDLEQAVE